MKKTEKTYRFRWFGELSPSERSYEETKAIFEPYLDVNVASENLRERLSTVDTGGYLLDFGCNYGTLSYYLAQKGNRVLALDLDADCIEIGVDFFSHPDLEYRCGNFFSMGFEDGT